ncbi:aminopeptidase P family protein [Pseudoflavitalea sp. G-6-1-2]|uniref:aminopeptidase P family protein n=1 Tax=Pseudoflavitalea sp. G-6-1-2 TaxID=2728841 RepID=UPI00146CEE7A|nr:aminopeptidase P family protein [Pseudoflavitalea sp. G-6-1-2]NML22499.1 aminopeptidase P family protein [Pseudoflavitalea sp. G-6-1-2]
MRICLSVMTLLLMASVALSQENNLPQDYLSADFHAGRREALRQLMPDSSVTVVFAYPVRKFSNDVDYVYHPNPDLYYFSGYTEPNSVLLVFKEPQRAEDGSTYKELLFVQRRDATAEQWTGIRLGVEGAKSKLKFSHAYNAAEFGNFPINFAGCKQIIMAPFPADIDLKATKGDGLYTLMNQFKTKAGFTGTDADKAKFATGPYFNFTTQLREIKTEEEMLLLRKAVEISCNGQVEVMKAVRADMSEREIQGLHEFVHKKYGAEEVGYPSIVGAGNNGCVLHYQENNDLRVENRMVLMDVGAQYHGYTADVTRTIPASGKFTAEQKQIYNLVYEAQEAAFKISKDGASWQDLDKVSREVILDGLVKLGIAKNKTEAGKYYPHGLGHHIGLDVHDRGSYGFIKKGMVITIEPGIYIPKNSNCDPKWWTIAVRIEDDILIREKDYELLSRNAPRKAEEIEKTIAEKSVFDNFVLPPLQSGKKGF